MCVCVWCVGAECRSGSAVREVKLSSSLRSSCDGVGWRSWYYQRWLYSYDGNGGGGGCGVNNIGGVGGGGGGGGGSCRGGGDVRTGGTARDIGDAFV